MIRRLSAGVLAVNLLFQSFPPQLFAYLTYAKWNSPNISYYINPQNRDVTAAAALGAVQGAANAWSVQTGSSVRLLYGGQVTDTATILDGRNVVMFRNATSGLAIATTYSWWDVNDRMLDADIIFWDERVTFYTGTSGCKEGGISNSAYIEDIATHEWGHLLGMSHSTVSGATMYSGYSYCSQTQRSLNADDKAGILSLYTAGGTPVVAPSISQHPQSISRAVGEIAVFSVVAAGSTPLTYRWQSKASGAASFSNISGSTGSSHTTPALTLSSNGRQYRCLVTNSAGTTTSNAALLTVTSGTLISPSFTQHPVSISRTVGQTGVFSVVAAGSSPLTYRWQSRAVGSTGFSNISGATASSYTTAALTLADQGKRFRCVVTNSAGNKTSNEATVTVNATQTLTLTSEPKRSPKIEKISMIGQSSSGSARVLANSQITVTANANSYTVRAEGSEFSSGDILQWNDSGVSTTLVGTSEFTAVLPAALVKNGSAKVQIATPDGDLSEPFMFNILLAADTLGDVRVYPNPWREDRHSGPFYFANLSTDSKVKMFTVSGRLVKSIPNLGGSAAWDLTTDSGDKVASGIYLYLIEDGSDKKTGKIVVIK